jgi:hypothetical protein
MVPAMTRARRLRVRGDRLPELKCDDERRQLENASPK